MISPMKIRAANELVRNITIKLGYANAKGCYCLYCSDREDRPPCEHHMKLLRYVSFVDSSRHNILMATVLNGAGVMDTSLLLIAGNESYLQPQISEYLTTVEIMKLQNIIIMQNKVDLIKEVQTLGHQKSIAVFVMKGTVTEASPIVPISAQLKYNVDAVNEYIVKRISIPVRDFTSLPRLLSSALDELMGGVAGSTILTGVLTLGMHFAAPGGLIGVGTMGNPMLCHSDRLVGQVLGAVGKLPHIYICASACFLLLRRLLGVKTEDKKTTNVVLLLINNGSILAGTCVLSVKMDFEMLMHPLPVIRSHMSKTHWEMV
ncbi:translation initiation factor eIF2 gamma subunit [Phellopilus nigrolimitatus]|nr:translation initiation factor eIF2 gamma subunit [Phellopilus nigrolimitatus]